MKPTREQIDQQMNAALEASDLGITDYPNSTYEDGVLNTLQWQEPDMEVGPPLKED